MSSTPYRWVRLAVVLTVAGVAGFLSWDAVQAQPRGRPQIPPGIQRQPVFPPGGQPGPQVLPPRPPPMPVMPQQPGFPQANQPGMPNPGPRNPFAPRNPGGMNLGPEGIMGGGPVWICKRCNRELGPAVGPPPKSCRFCGVTFTEVTYDDGRPPEKISAYSGIDPMSAMTGGSGSNVFLALVIAGGALLFVGLVVGGIVFLSKQLGGAPQRRKRPRRRPVYPVDY